MYSVKKDSINETRVRIEAPARIHLGFMDLDGGLGRRFGSLGLTLAELSTRIAVRKADGFHSQGPTANTAQRYAKRIFESLSLEGGVHIEVESAIPTHVGLGSGTQMALAVGSAIDHLFDLDLGIRRIVKTLGRGKRSGIGIGAFQDGGFLVDGGCAGDSRLPPVTVRLAFPDQWRILLILDDRGQGLHGAEERETFEKLPPFTAAQAGRLCRVVMMSVLPALVEQELERFGAGIGEMQRTVGDYFASLQGGRFTSPAVNEVLEWLVAQGVSGVGQSSWGPTGFAVTDSETRAYALLRSLKRRFGQRLPLRYWVLRARNHGHIVEKTNHDEQFPVVEAGARR
jgi:beta-RFAP synthase